MVSHRLLRFVFPIVCYSQVSSCCAIVVICLGMCIFLMVPLHADEDTAKSDGRTPSSSSSDRSDSSGSGRIAVTVCGSSLKSTLSRTQSSPRLATVLGYWGMHMRGTRYYLRSKYHITRCVVYRVGRGGEKSPPPPTSPPPYPLPPGTLPPGACKKKFGSLRSTWGPALAPPLNNKTPAVAIDRLVCAPPCVCTALCAHRQPFPHTLHTSALFT